MKLVIQNGSITLQGNTILERVDFDICDGEHVAIVGRNGCGKTTFLNGLINHELFDMGTGEEKFKIESIGSYSIGYLHQMDFNEDTKLYDELLKPFSNLIQMENKLSRLEKELETNSSYDVLNEYNKILDNYKYNGGYTYKKEIEVMLNKFGFESSDKDKKMSEFSGGQKTKLSFIILLLTKPDLLLLDEPTNHLDITTIEWLEDYLKKYKGAIVLVSHDRMFMDNIVTKVFDIDYGEMVKYTANYTKYMKLKEERYDKLVSDYNKQQAEIKRLNDIYLRFRSKPTKASMALSRLKKIEQMDIIDKPNKIDKNTFKINLNGISEPAKIVLKADKIKFGYDTPLGEVSLEIKKGTKLGIIGANGTGKSTLLKTLNGNLNPLDGTVSYGLGVKCGYFDQNLKTLTNGSVLTEFREYLPEFEMEAARSALGSFLFKGEDVTKNISVLSGGEKVRLELCKILYNKPNVLLLDEPTNHLDIVGKSHLESILSDYPGTVIFVSHDRYFVNNIADELLVFENNEIKHFKYGYKEYMEYKNKEVIVVDEKKKKKVVEVKEEKIDYKKELNKIEKEIININNKINKLQMELFNENVYNDFNQSNSINNKIEELTKELNEKELLWENITDELLKKE